MTPAARTEIDDLVRGVAGGMLFGIPLLYTMEVWEIGATSGRLSILAVLATTFLPVLALTRTAGFRGTRDVRLSDAARDAVEAVAIGLLCAAGVLVLLRELTPSTPAAVAVGKIVYEAVPYAIGVALARQFLTGDREHGAGSDGEDEDDAGRGGALGATARDLGATAIGATLIAFNIAPTDEVPLLWSGMGPAWLVVLVVASLLISYVIVFAAGLTKVEQRRSSAGLLQSPVVETVACYVVALAAALAMQVFFQRLDAAAPLGDWIGHTIVLGLPAAVGGAAGRLAV